MHRDIAKVVHLRAFGFKTRRNGHVVCARVDVRLHKIQVHVKGVAKLQALRGEPIPPGGCQKKTHVSKRFNVILGCDLVARFNRIEGKGA
jgi:hypothetical protein